MKELRGNGVETGVAVGLGSNQGDRGRHLARAQELLDRRFGVEEVSALYATDASGPDLTGEFLNRCVILVGAPEPGELLDGLLEIESKAGRARPGPERGGDRTLDLDLLLYRDRRIRRAGLVVPHPRMLERAFVMIPLRDVAARWIVPGTGRTVASLAADLDGAGVRRLEEARTGRRRERGVL
jgi:2-amino-4-hydroxy-6-hydroxymethyldihydropteridine diphosphokinase